MNSFGQFGLKWAAAFAVTATLGSPGVQADPVVAQVNLDLKATQVADVKFYYPGLNVQARDGKGPASGEEFATAAINLIKECNDDPKPEKVTRCYGKRIEVLRSRTHKKFDELAELLIKENPTAMVSLEDACKTQTAKGLFKESACLQRQTKKMRQHLALLRKNLLKMRDLTPSQGRKAMAAAIGDDEGGWALDAFLFECAARKTDCSSMKQFDMFLSRQAEVMSGASDLVNAHHLGAQFLSSAHFQCETHMESKAPSMRNRCNPMEIVTNHDLIRTQLKAALETVSKAGEVGYKIGTAKDSPQVDRATKPVNGADSPSRGTASDDKTGTGNAAK